MIHRENPKADQRETGLPAITCAHVCFWVYGNPSLMKKVKWWFSSSFPSFSVWRMVFRFSPLLGWWRKRRIRCPKLLTKSYVLIRSSHNELWFPNHHANSKTRPVTPRWQTLPYGDPSETTTAPRHRCDDAVVRAHGAVTQAVPWHDDNCAS